MKQVMQNYRTGTLEVVDLPAPLARKGTVLVASRVSLISSGTERQLMELAKASLAAKAIARPDLVRQVLRNVRRDGLKPTIDKVFAKLDTPIPLGYSLAGEVIELGHQVGEFAVGDRVACAGAGLANHAEFNAVPKNLSVKIPDGVSYEAASFVTLGAIALQGVRLVEPALGERVVVMGLGLIGLLTVQLLKAAGCLVIGFDPNPERAGLARKLGADVVITEDIHNAVATFSGGHGADAVLIAASSKSSEPLNTSAEISRLKGRIVVVGMVGMAIDRKPFYERELQLRLSMSYGPGRHDPNYEFDGHDYPFAYVRWTEKRNMEAFLGLVAEGKVSPEALVSHRFAIDQADRAYTLMEGKEPYLAILLNYPEDAEYKVERSVNVRPVPIAREGNKIAFIGFGNYSKSVLFPAIQAINRCTFTTVVTQTGTSAGHAAKKYNFGVAATDPDAAINDDITDTIFIATRHDTHADLAARSLHAGKHVFCEKPLATNFEGLEQVENAAKKSAGVVTVGFNRRFSPLMLQAKAQLIPRSGPLVMLYRVNAGPISNDSWVQREEGGGRIIGEVCHFVDALIFLSGSLPTEVHAVSVRDHADALSVILKFGDGSIGTIIYSSLGDQKVPKEYIEVFASGFVIQLDDFSRLTVTSNGKRNFYKTPHDKGQEALVKSFIEATRGQAPVPIPLDELLAASITTFGIEESLRIGCPVDLRPPT